ncbi:MAG: hypothetical protein Kow00121_10620 [Elainellaceae cyanobacterium]
MRAAEPVGTLIKNLVVPSMRRIAKGQIRPKISTMPRQQSEAAAVLDVYKLVIEKKRLEQELQGIDQRRQQILDRLATLESQVAGLEQTAHQLRSIESRSIGSSRTEQPLPRAAKPAVVDLLMDEENLETLFLEY